MKKMNSYSTWEIGCDGGDAHYGTLGWSVAPRLIVAGKDTQMAPANKILVVQSEQRISRR